jgi:hypothetical protein
MLCFCMSFISCIWQLHVTSVPYDRDFTVCVYNNSRLMWLLIMWLMHIDTYLPICRPAGQVNLLQLQSKHYLFYQSSYTLFCTPPPQKERARHALIRYVNDMLLYLGSSTISMAMGLSWTKWIGRTCTVSETDVNHMLWLSEGATLMYQFYVRLCLLYKAMFCDLMPEDQPISSKSNM